MSFDAGRGELLAVLGPNGAGKTTLLSILAGIAKPDSGRIERSNGEVGWVPQQAGLYRRLTVEENLRLFARMEEAEDVEATIERMLEQTGLEDRRHDQVSVALGRQPAAHQHRHRAARRPVRASARRAQLRASTRASGSASGSSSRASPRAGRR